MIKILICRNCKKFYKNYGIYYERHIKKCNLRYQKLFSGTLIRVNNDLSKLPLEIKRILNELTENNLSLISNYINSFLHYNYLKNKYPEFYKKFNVNLKNKIKKELNLTK